jgi:hypothetical protein
MCLMFYISLCCVCMCMSHRRFCCLLTCLFTSDLLTLDVPVLQQPVLFLDVSFLQQSALSLEVSGLQQHTICADPGHVSSISACAANGRVFLHQFLLSMDVSALHQQPELSQEVLAWAACNSPGRIRSTTACTVTGGVWHTAFAVSRHVCLRELLYFTWTCRSTRECAAQCTCAFMPLLDVSTRDYAAPVHICLPVYKSYCAAPGCVCIQDPDLYLFLCFCATTLRVCLHEHVLHLLHVCLQELKVQPELYGLQKIFSICFNTVMFLFLLFG